MGKHVGSGAMAGGAVSSTGPTVRHLGAQSDAHPLGKLNCSKCVAAYQILQILSKLGILVPKICLCVVFDS